MNKEELLKQHYSELGKKSAEARKKKWGKDFNKKMREFSLKRFEKLSTDE